MRTSTTRTKSAIATLLRELMPDLAITCSADLVREYREYERFSTAVVNAALLPAVRRYLDRFRRGVRAAGVDAPVFAMRSDGGMAAIAIAAERPAALIESGPAAGVIAAAYLGTTLGLERVLSFDMGGTTAKAGTIFGGTPEIANEFEAAGATHSGRARKGSGYPVRFPFVDLAEISAGAARSPGSTPRARCASGPFPPERIPDRPHTGAASRRRSPMRTSCSAA